MAALATTAQAHVNGDVAPTTTEEDSFYAQLIRLRDAVIAGSHPTLSLPTAAIEQLKASLVLPESSGNVEDRIAQNGAAATINGTLANTEPSSQHAPNDLGLPGLTRPETHVTSAKKRNAQALEPDNMSSGLDPIFLERSDVLKRAEGQLKRQRIERAMLDMVDKRKHSAGREVMADVPSDLNVAAILADAQEKVKHTSGVKLAIRTRTPSAATSFDTNDYYSSQVDSDWSLDASSSKGSDRALGSFTADFQRLEEPKGVAHQARKIKETHGRGANGLAPAGAKSHASQGLPITGINEADGVHEADDEDDDYIPPEPAALDNFHEEDTATDMRPVYAEDEADYEPDDDTYDPEFDQPNPVFNEPAPISPRVPIIRNHLTHIAAPQPNRVSPLAVQKGPSIEMELVNGRPEIVKKPAKRSRHMQSRPSSASPPGPGTGISSRKEKKNKKKRKREDPPHLKRSKPRHGRSPARSPPSASRQQQYIKPEPMSPPPLARIPSASQYAGYTNNYAQPIEIDLDSPRHAPRLQYAPAGQQYAYTPAPIYEQAARTGSPALVRVAAAPGQRPVRRDNQDLRRVATMHSVQRPRSPLERVYSPVSPYTTAQYGAPRSASVGPASRDGRYQDDRTVTLYDAGAGPARLQEYRESSPALMPPPTAPPRRIVVDQYGNQFYAAEPVPVPRASVVPPASYQDDVMNERAPSRMSVAQVAQPPQPVYRDIQEPRMAPPPPPIRRQVSQDQIVEYVDAHGYPVKAYNARPAEPTRYSVAPTSPVYQQYDQMPPPSRQAIREPRYEHMPPPPVPQPPPQPTSPVYAHVPRAQSVMQDGYESAIPGYSRQANVAPVQYARHDIPPPARAASVVPSHEYAEPVYQQQPQYVPQQVRYVDEYGREVAPRDIRQGSQFR